jgi:hypothetical protein
VKSIMPWIKANVPIVVLSALILLVLPASFVGSSFWNKHIQRKRSDEANKAWQDLDGLKISYALPTVFPGGTPITKPLDAPNPNVSGFFREHRKALEDQVSKVAGVAKELNQGDHGLLVQGLFVAPPPPPDAGGAPPATGAPVPTGTPVPAAVPGAPTPAPNAVDPLKALELVDLMVGKGDKPSVYQQALNSIHAGGPADAVKVAEVLEEIRQQYMDKVKAQSNRTTLTPDEQTELTKKLVDARIGEYRQHAADLSVYATRDNLPRIPPSESPDAATCYLWHFDYWMVSDLLKAVDAANTFNGQRTPVEQSVVKRIERITLDPAGGDSTASITGRKSSAENKLYDVRDADLSVVVSSSRLPELINAISRTNFMTVIGLDFKDADPWTDLNDGYFYGDDPVVKAHLRIETIWLRSWTEALMPQQIRDLFTPPVAEAAPAPAPAPVQRASPKSDSKKPAPQARPKRARRGDDGG